MKKISVIVPCYNVADYVEICLANLLNQTIGFDNIEVILIDDASTDGGHTARILRQFEREHTDNVILIENKENMGAGGCRNTALEYASGEYIAYCDADDWFHVLALEQTYTFAKTYDADVVEFGIRIVNEHSGKSEQINETDGVLTVISTEDERKQFILPGDFRMESCNKLYRTEMLKKFDIRFLEHAIYEETPFTYLVRLYATRYYKTDLAYYYYYQREESSSRQYYKRFDDVHKSYNMYITETKCRGFYDNLHEEIDFVYWSGYFFLPLLNMAKTKSFCDKEEYKKYQRNICLNINDIRTNRYLEQFLPNRKLLGDLTYIDVDKVDYSDIVQYFSALA